MGIRELSQWMAQVQKKVHKKVLSLFKVPETVPKKLFPPKSSQ